MYAQVVLKFPRLTPLLQSLLRAPGANWATFVPCPISILLPTPSPVQPPASSNPLAPSPTWASYAP